MRSYEENEKKRIIETIRKYFPAVKIIAFGSRIQGTHQQYSDLDLCLDWGKPLPFADWAMLADEFVESDLPYTIDLTDWHRISDSFKMEILQTGIVW